MPKGGVLVMKGKTYRVHLTEDERRRLEDIVTKGVHPARQIIRARILLCERRHRAGTQPE
jgi:hypothetical protein